MTVFKNSRYPKGISQNQKTRLISNVGGKRKTILSKEYGETQAQAYARHTRNVTVTKVDKGFGNTYQHYKVNDGLYKHGDAWMTIENCKNAIVKTVLDKIKESGKPQLVALDLFTKMVNREGKNKDNSFMRGRNVTVRNKQEILDWINHSRSDIFEAMSAHREEGSDWAIKEINGLHIDMWNSPNSMGRRFFEVHSIKGRGCGIGNPHNLDQYCLLWAVIGCLHPENYTSRYKEGCISARWKKQAQSFLGMKNWEEHPIIKAIEADAPNVYSMMEDLLKQNLLVYRMVDSLSDIKDLPVQEYGSRTYPTSIRIIKVIHATNNSLSHFVSFLNPSAVLKQISGTKDAIHYCFFCNRKFKTADESESANHECYPDEASPQIVQMPEKGSLYEFKMFHALIPREVYAFSTIIGMPTIKYEQNEDVFYTSYLHNVDARSISLEVVCDSPDEELQQLCQNSSTVISSNDEFDIESINDEMKRLTIDEEFLDDDEEDDFIDEELDEEDSTETGRVKMSSNEKDAMKNFLNLICLTFDPLMRKIKAVRGRPMNRLTDQQLKEYRDATKCCLCLKDGDWQDWKSIQKSKMELVGGKRRRVMLDEWIKVPDDKSKRKHHYHHNNQFIGAAHNKCNQQAQCRNEIVIVVKDLSRWGHSIVRTYKEGIHGFRLYYLRVTAEKIRSISFKRFFYTIRLIDHESYIKDNSIPDLVSRLRKYNDPMIYTERLLANYSTEVKDKLLKTTFSKLYPDGDPSFEYDNYCKIIARLSSTLLADYFNHFRAISLEKEGIEPLCFLGNAGRGEACWLRKNLSNGIKVGLIHDQSMYEFWKKQMIGGMCRVSRTYMRANLPHLDWYNPNKPIKTIHDIDFTMLYPYIGCGRLPDGRSFERDDTFFEGEEMWSMFDKLFDGIRNYGLKWVNEDDRTHGHLIIIDMYLPTTLEEWKERVPSKYHHLPLPDNLHDLHEQFPSNPVRRVVQFDEYSNYQQAHWHRTYHDGRTFSKVERIINDLHEKKDYCLRDESLLFEIMRGWIPTCIKSVITFSQDYVMRDFMEECTKQRASYTRQGLTALADHAKTKPSAVVGRTMMDTSKFLDCGIRSQKQIERLQLKRKFQRGHIMMEDDNSALCVWSKGTVRYNRPIFLGVDVYFKSKLLMTKVATAFLLYFGKDVEIAYTDTDSLFISLSGDLPMERLRQLEIDFGLTIFDWDKTREAGVFKFVSEGKVIVEFVAVKSKMYSVRYDDDSEKISASGVSNDVKESLLRHVHLLYALRSDHPDLDEEIKEALLYHEKEIDQIGVNDGVFLNQYKDIVLRFNTTHTRGGQNIEFEESRVAVSHFDVKSWRGADNRINLPFGHYLAVD